MSASDPARGGPKVNGVWWHVVRGAGVDTTVEPQWLRTGYMYFPYAAWQDQRWWVIRVNYCFPEHDLATLFIDGAAVAETTADPNDARPLVASIGRLPLTNSVTAENLPMLTPQPARDVVSTVAEYVAHGSEWDDPCDWCILAERDPFAPA